MLNVWFGKMPEAIYDTSTYFKHAYKDQWITDPMTMEMILDVDRSEVKGAEPCAWSHFSDAAIRRCENIDPHL